MSWFARHKMVGGLVFGPPAWHARRIDETFDKDAAVQTGTVAAVDGDVPAAREAQIEFLARIGLGRTSQIVPAVMDQLREGAGRGIKLFALSLLPTQPEFIFGPALSHLAMDDVLRGFLWLAKASRARTWMVVLDRHDFHTRRLWRRARRGQPWREKKGSGPAAASLRDEALRRIRFKCLLNRYPQSDPTILARTLLGKQLPVGALPTRVGLLLADPVFCWALGRYLRTARTFIDRPVQLFSGAGAEPRLVLGRIGETIQSLCERHEHKTAGRQIIINGMLAGSEVETAGVVIGPATESIAVRSMPDAEKPSPCLACGWCVDVCPTGLRPVHLMELAQRIPTGLELMQGSPRAAPDSTARLLKSRDAQESLDCISCGLCSYVCPTRLPLMQETLRLRTRVAIKHSTDNGEKQG